MFLKVFAFTLAIGIVVAKPQLITFKDGKIGVNFGGYHAEAGLGGFLTGNAAHGGLSASAGTPHGQRAAAGIGGTNGDSGTYGGAYAGATAGQGISARAGLGGTVGGGGLLGAEASSGGKTKTVIKTVGSVNEEQPLLATDDEAEYENVVQKIKPPKKYAAENSIIIEKTVGISSPNLDTRFAVAESEPESPSVPPPAVIKTITKSVAKPIESKPVVALGNVEQESPPQVFVYRKHVRPLRRRFKVRKQYAPIAYQPTQVIKTVEKRPVYASPSIEFTKRTAFVQDTAPVHTQPATIHHTASAQGSFGGSNFFDSIFNIPISTLRAVNGFLNQNVGQGSFAVKKTVDVQQR